MASAFFQVLSNSQLSSHLYSLSCWEYLEIDRLELDYLEIDRLELGYLETDRLELDYLEIDRLELEYP